MNSEVGQWLLSRTPFGCLVRSVLVLFAVLIIPIWGFDQYLHWRETQHSQPAMPSGPSLPAIHLDYGRPLLALSAIVLGVLLVLAVRRFASAGHHRRLYRAVQGAGALLALSQPGLLVGAAITLAVCWERP